MYRLPILLVAGFALLAAGTVPASGGGAPEADAPTHTLAIDYQQTRGDLRRATVSIVLSSESHEPTWRKNLANISVLTTEGQWIIIESFRERDGSLEARAMLPPPETISAIVMIGEVGYSTGWNVGEGDTIAEWTYLNQDGRAIPKPAPLANDDDCRPVSTGCQVSNPWTCECDIPLQDPAEVRVSDDQIMLSI